MNARSGFRLPVFSGGPVPILRFPQITATGIVEHGSTTRIGGVSEGYWSSLNLCSTRGDDRAKVLENMRRVGEIFSVSLDRFVCSMQTHTTNVRTVTEADAGKGTVRERDYDDVDGLITNEPELVLGIFTADCVPLYFVDPVHRAIGLSHSGWKGTVGRIGRKTAERMRQEFGTEPADLVCAIGPSICQSCYEVGPEVAVRFEEEFAGREKEILLPKSGGKYLLDLWAANRIVLEEAGVRPENISCTELCTCCQPELLFSHRATGGKRGNLGAFLMLKAENREKYGKMAKLNIHNGTIAVDITTFL